MESSSSSHNISKEEYIAITSECRKNMKAGIDNAFQMVCQKYYNKEKGVPSYVVLGATLGCVEAASNALLSSMRNKVLTPVHVAEIVGSMLNELLKDEDNEQTRDRNKDN